MPDRDDVATSGASRAVDEEESARRASELAHRALQEAVESLERAQNGRVTPELLEELEAAVDRARQLVATAQIFADRSRNAVDVARRQRDAAGEMIRDTVAAAERVKHGFMAMVTWGRRHAACRHCGRQFVVSYRCSNHQPTVDAEVRCPWDGCGATVPCTVAASAYAFSTRTIQKRA